MVSVGDPSEVMAQAIEDITVTYTVVEDMIFGDEYDCCYPADGGRYRPADGGRYRGMGSWIW